MMAAQIVVALVIGVVLAMVLVLVFRWQRPGAKGYWSSLLFLAVLLFMSNWAAGLWIPVGEPSSPGVRWVPSLVTGVVLAILLLVLVPRRPRTAEEAERRATLEAGTPGVISLILWILIIALAISIAAYYLM